MVTGENKTGQDLLVVTVQETDKWWFMAVYKCDDEVPSTMWDLFDIITGAGNIMVYEEY
jgi:hypothetical protein